MPRDLIELARRCVDRLDECVYVCVCVCHTLQDSVSRDLFELARKEDHTVALVVEAAVYDAARARAETRNQKAAPLVSDDTHIHTHARARTHTHTHAHTHTHTHTHIHTQNAISPYTRSQKSWWGAHAIVLPHKHTTDTQTKSWSFHLLCVRFCRRLVC